MRWGIFYPPYRDQHESEAKKDFISSSGSFTSWILDTVTGSMNGFTILKSMWNSTFGRKICEKWEYFSQLGFKKKKLPRSWKQIPDNYLREHLRSFWVLRNRHFSAKIRFFRNIRWTFCPDRGAFCCCDKTDWEWEKKKIGYCVKCGRFGYLLNANSIMQIANFSIFL